MVHGVRARLAFHLLVLACVTVSSSARAQGRVRVNGPAPDFKLPLISGGELALSQLKGKVVLLNFGASW